MFFLVNMCIKDYLYVDIVTAWNICPSLKIYWAGITKEKFSGMPGMLFIQKPEGHVSKYKIIT